MATKNKMFTPERLSLILLAIAVVAFAIVVFMSNHKGPTHTAATPATIADTTAATNKTDTVLATKSKRRSKSKKETKAKEAPRQRDHLREIVPEE